MKSWKLECGRDGTWFAIHRRPDRTLLGYGRSRAAALAHCFVLVLEHGR